MKPPIIEIAPLLVFYVIIKVLEEKSPEPRSAFYSADYSRKHLLSVLSEENNEILSDEKEEKNRTQAGKPIEKFPKIRKLKHHFLPQFETVSKTENTHERTKTDTKA
ncbi:MAG: hypothetical protein J1F28_00535 [Oscillospiraceae bacterium]|nr:hypothetical protein [Oscillospiraceae bacterium]